MGRLASCTCVHMYMYARRLRSVLVLGRHKTDRTADFHCLQDEDVCMLGPSHTIDVRALRIGLSIKLMSKVI